MMEVCKGLAHAHDQRDGDGRPLGIVHRDISPPNILISKSGEVKITDFGLAKAATQLEQTDAGIVKGKFSYLSPEAANGVTVDHRADLFAVGILLWELLANRRLFVGKTDLDTIDLVRDAEIPALSLFNRDVTPQLEQIVSRALAQDVRARWHSARDLGDELARYLFSNNLKVTAYDLAAQIQGLMAEEGEVVDSAERLVLLVEEEIQNLSMLGLLGDGIRMDGAQPLNEADFQSAPTSRLAVADVWRTRSDPDLSSRIDLADLLEKLDAQGADSSRLRAASDSSRRNWVVALAVGVLLLGGAALAWFAF
jgi:serine/threonine-protein kinase